ncbi:uncharacterized protein LOC106068502 isoform X3 [Biomphalaria glabrata]|uniref:Uncharacterized protein LOC106068502 isoform X3 n=2 Tax=Biomphalaria glabrata TaxID=6526 RepID=A0A9W2YX55_BIOGL|nr:uncharacterized protein LOC106068502 isoform X3 [Biomphalaria glabrata]
MEMTRSWKLSYRLVVLALGLFLGSLSKSTDREESIILQENVSKSMDMDISSSNLKIENTIYIRSNNITLCVCRQDNVCNKKDKSNIFNVTKTKDGILRVYFENVVRNNPIQINGTWQVCNTSEIGNKCDETLTRHVFIYAQLDYFNCTYEFVDVDHKLNISCTILNIYPQAVCSFDTQKVLSEIEYNHSQVPGYTTYFNSRCSITLEINNEFFQVKTTIYPNITGDITDTTYGINVTLSVMNVSTLSSSKKCFVEGSSTSISSCRCRGGLLENVTTAFFFETTLNIDNSQPVYCNTTTQLSEMTTLSQNTPEVRSSQATTSSRWLKNTSVSSQPRLDFAPQGTASLMTTSLTIIIIIGFTLLTMILLYRFVSYPKHLMSVRITKSYMRLTKNNKGDEIDNTDIYHLFNKITCENDHYTTIEDLKKEKERQSSESFYTSSELTQNGDFHVLKNFRTAGCSMKLEKNWDLDIYEKI